MTKHPKKKDFPVSEIRRYLELGPIALVSSSWRGRNNIMTMGRYTVIEFSPSLVGCIISNRNHSFDMIRRSKECVINIPTTELTNQVVGIGNSTGAEINKFEKFGVTPLPALKVMAPLIAECYANLECRLFDSQMPIPEGVRVRPHQASW